MGIRSDWYSGSHWDQISASVNTAWPHSQEQNPPSQLKSHPAPASLSCPAKDTSSCSSLLVFPLKKVLRVALLPWHCWLYHIYVNEGRLNVRTLLSIKHYKSTAAQSQHYHQKNQEPDNHSAVAHYRWTLLDCSQCQCFWDSHFPPWLSIPHVAYQGQTLCQQPSCSIAKERHCQEELWLSEHLYSIWHPLCLEPRFGSGKSLRNKQYMYRIDQRSKMTYQDDKIIDR